MTKFVVGRVDELPAGSRHRVEVDGRGIAVFNVEGQFYALRDICPHRGARLSAGTVVGSLRAPCAGEYVYDEEQMFVKCPWHGWEFDLETGQSYCEPEKERVRHYDVVVEHGDQVLAEAARPATRIPGDFSAEIVPITVEDDYVVLDV
jgi:nitrite reductase/ring-hydroxylating ferredoxin subunit